MASWLLVAVLCAQLICQPYDTALANRLDASTLAVLYVSVSPPHTHILTFPAQATQALSWLYYARPSTAAAGESDGGAGDELSDAVITAVLLGVNAAMCAALAVQFSRALHRAVRGGRGKGARIGVPPPLLAPPPSLAPKPVVPVSSGGGDTLTQPSAIGHEVVALDRTGAVSVLLSPGSEVSFSPPAKEMTHVVGAGSSSFTDQSESKHSQRRNRRTVHGRARHSKREPSCASLVNVIVR